MKFSGSRLGWLLLTFSCPNIRQFLELIRFVSVLICGVLISCTVSRDLCFWGFSEISREFVVLTNRWLFRFSFSNKITYFHFDFSFHFVFLKIFPWMIVLPVLFFGY